MDLVGQHLGQYEIIREIAKGGMATVYLARQKSMNRDVAIKFLPKSLMHDNSFLDRFYREVDVIANLQHPHILPVHDFGEFDGSPYITMAYLSGGNLGDLINQGPMDADDIVHIISQVADALDYAHGKGIIHRDIKPSNVLLDERGYTYLADFGLAKIAEGDSQITGTAILGTPTYMAPEQASPAPLTAAADVYALGVMLFQMITGRVPFEAPSSVGLLMAHATQPVPDVRAMRDNLPTALQAVILKSMAKSVEARYQTAGTLARELADALKKSTQEFGGLAQSSAGLIMTNMLGNIIFIDHPCMKLLKRHQRDARAIIGKPLHDVLGFPKSITDKLLKGVQDRGMVDDIEFEVTDANGKSFPAACEAIATKDDRGSFVGMDLNLRNIATAPATPGSFETIEKHLDTTEETYLQTYFTSQITALRDLAIRIGGKRIGNNLERIINETAERNVWPVSMEKGVVRVELRSSDADIYRALLAKAVVYVVGLVGKGPVSRELEAVESRMDSRVLELVNELRVHELLQDIL